MGKIKHTSKEDLETIKDSLQDLTGILLSKSVLSICITLCSLEGSENSTNITLGASIKQKEKIIYLIEGHLNHLKNERSGV